jgi:hypothetical protein
MKSNIFEKKSICKNIILEINDFKEARKSINLKNNTNLDELNIKNIRIKTRIEHLPALTEKKLKATSKIANKIVKKTL